MCNGNIEPTQTFQMRLLNKLGSSDAVNGNSNNSTTNIFPGLLQSINPIGSP